MVKFPGRRQAVESLYFGVCTVKVQEQVKNPITKITTTQEVIKLENLKCKLSFERKAFSGQGDIANNVVQVTKLFCAPELDIKPGSKIIVTQNGVTKEYQHAGESAVYMDHQEIMLDIFTGYRSYA